MSSRELREVLSETGGHCMLTVAAIKIWAQSAHISKEELKVRLLAVCRSYVLNIKRYLSKLEESDWIHYPIFAEALKTEYKDDSANNEEVDNDEPLETTQDKPSESPVESANDQVERESSSEKGPTNFPVEDESTRKILEEIPDATQSSSNNKGSVRENSLQNKNPNIWLKNFCVIVVPTVFLMVGAFFVNILSTVLTEAVLEDGQWSWSNLLLLDRKVAFAGTLICFMLTCIPVAIVHYSGNDRDFNNTRESVIEMYRRIPIFLKHHLWNPIEVFVKSPRYKWVRWVLLIIICIFTVVHLHQPTQTWAKAVLQPSRQEASLNQRAKENLENFQDVQSGTTQVEVLERALVIADESDSFQNLKTNVNFFLFWRSKADMGVVPRLALQYIYDRINEFKNFQPSSNSDGSVGLLAVGESYQDNEGTDGGPIYDTAVSISKREVALLRGNGELISPFNTSQNGIEDLKFARLEDGRRIVMTAGLGEIKAWDLGIQNIEEELGTVKWGGVAEEEGAVSPGIYAVQLLENRLLTALSATGYLKIWELNPNSFSTGGQPPIAEEQVQDYTGETSDTINNHIRSSDHCLAISGYLDNQEERLQIWPIDKIKDGSLSDPVSIPIDYKPTSIDINGEGSLLAVAGELKNESDVVLTKIELIALNAVENRCTLKYAPDRRIQILTDEESSLSISDVRLSADSKKLFVMYANGSFDVYALDIPMDSGEIFSDVTEYKPNIIFHDEINLSKTNMNARIVPSPTKHFRFLTLAGRNVRFWDMTANKDEAEYIYERKLEGDLLKNSNLDGKRKLAVENFFSIPDESSPTNVFLSLLDTDELVLLNLEFSNLRRPSLYKNKRVTQIESSVSSTGFFFVIVERSEENDTILRIYKHSLDSPNSEEGNVSTLSFSGDISAMTFNPTRSELVFSDGKSIRHIDNFLDPSSTPIPLSLRDQKIDKVRSLSFDSGGNLIAFLSDKNLVICDLNDRDNPMFLGSEGPQLEFPIVSSRAYESVKFKPESQTAMGIRKKKYVFAMTTDGEQIDVFEIDPKKNVELIQTLSIKRIRDEWGAIDAALNSPWTSWSFDRKGERLALGAKDQLLILDLSQGMKRGLEKNLIAIHQANSPGSWGDIELLASGSTSADQEQSRIVGLGENGVFIQASYDGSYDDIKGWSCKWLEEHHKHSITPTSTDASNICGNSNLFQNIFSGL